ncbi:hypothetical protein [Acidiphilium sp.]|uniref:hypothetical protein n=1 Tax=Acidiphilium sp. TaxID=527 RepID=UPI00258303BE|nr:hypothetical protein [Acidiphilium sp.]
MNRIRLETTTKPASNDNAATLGGLEAVLARHAAELRALAATPVQRALVARAAVRMIERTMAAGAVR